MPKDKDSVSGAFRPLFAGCCVLAVITSSAAADADHGKEIATRWCASCHLIERGQTSATDQAPPFIYFAWREFTAAGGLMNYGSSIPDAYHQIGI